MDYFDKFRLPNYAVDVQVAEELLDHRRQKDDTGNPNSIIPSENLLRAPEPFESFGTPRKSAHDRSTGLAGHVHTRNTSGFSGSNSSTQTNANLSVSSHGSVNLAATSYVEEYNSLARFNGLTELTEFDGGM